MAIASAWLVLACIAVGASIPVLTISFILKYLKTVNLRNLIP